MGFRKLLPSEKAFAYKMKLEAMKRQGVRTDLTLSQNETKLRSDEVLSKGTSEEINAYLNEKMKNKTFSFYYSRKFADFAGLFMCFFATIMLKLKLFRYKFFKSSTCSTGEIFKDDCIQ